jgi:hypothetical protein
VSGTAVPAASSTGILPVSPPAILAGVLDTGTDFLKKMHGRPIRRTKFLLTILMGEVRV